MRCCLSNGFGDGASATTAQKSKPLATLLTDGLLYGEAPRFRLSERKLYYVDSYANAVRCYDPETKTDDVVFEHDDYVSGLGWLPDGRMLIVSMNKQHVLVFDQHTKSASVYADLTGVVRSRANDMVVSSAGHAYVGNFGFDLSSLSTCTTTLVRVDPAAQSVHVEATGLFFPNGSVVTPDGKTLIVAETYGGKLTAFTISEDTGALSNRRVWADLHVPVDGMCLDAEGCVWVAVPQVGLYNTSGALVRVRDGGEIVKTLGFGANGISRSVFACQLGTDADGSHFLYFLEALTSDDTAILKHGRDEGKKNGVLKRIQVDIGTITSARLELPHESILYGAAPGTQDDSSSAFGYRWYYRTFGLGAIQIQSTPDLGIHNIQLIPLPSATHASFATIQFAATKTTQWFKLMENEYLTHIRLRVAEKSDSICGLSFHTNLRRSQWFGSAQGVLHELVAPAGFFIHMLHGSCGNGSCLNLGADASDSEELHSSSVIGDALLDRDSPRFFAFRSQSSMRAIVFSVDEQLRRVRPLTSTQYNRYVATLDSALETGDCLLELAEGELLVTTPRRTEWFGPMPDTDAIVETRGIHSGPMPTAATVHIGGIEGMFSETDGSIASIALVLYKKLQ